MKSFSFWTFRCNLSAQAWNHLKDEELKRINFIHYSFNKKITVGLLRFNNNMARSPIDRSPDCFASTDVGVAVAWFEWLVRAHQPHSMVRTSLGNLLGNFDNYYYFLADMPTMLLFVCYVYEARKHSINWKKNVFDESWSCWRFQFVFYRFLPSKPKKSHRTKRYFSCCFKCCQTITKSTTSLLPSPPPPHERECCLCSRCDCSNHSNCIITKYKCARKLEMTVFPLVGEHLFRRTWTYLQNGSKKKMSNLLTLWFSIEQSEKKSRTESETGRERERGKNAEFNCLYGHEWIRIYRMTVRGVFANGIAVLQFNWNKKYSSRKK